MTRPKAAGWKKACDARKKRLTEYVRRHPDTPVNELARMFGACRKTASRVKREVVGETAMPRKRPLPSITVPVLEAKRDRKPGTRPRRTLAYEADGTLYRLENCRDLPSGGRFVVRMLPPLAEV